MTGFMTQLLAALAVSLLRYLQQREDLKQSVRDDLEKEAMRHVIKATEYKARAAGLPYAAALRVRDTTISISISSPIAGAGSGTESESMRPEGPDR